MILIKKNNKYKLINELFKKYLLNSDKYIDYILNSLSKNSYIYEKSKLLI